MQLQFLWDAEKTKKLFKAFLQLFAVGAALSGLYTFALPTGNPYRVVTLALPIIFVLSCPIYYLLINKANIWWLYLIFSLEAQLFATVFMAVTGGFLGIIQFAPFVLLLSTIFALGVSATMILSAFTILTLVGLYFWMSVYLPSTELFLEFFYYLLAYILVTLIERTMGKEISLQVEARKKLEQIDDLKNQFITLSSHYLRTPITVIKGYVSVLDKTVLQPAQKHDLELINTNLKQLELLTEKMLAISSIEKGQTQISRIPSDINQLINSVVNEFKPLAMQKGVLLIYNLAENPPLEFSFDPFKIRQVLSNLIDNAIKYNKKDGSIVVSLKNNNHFVTITVADTGQGMTKEQLESLFTTFNRGGMEKILQSDTTGLGLSLYLSKLIVESHQGKISAESAPEKGTTFNVTLPIKSS